MVNLNINNFENGINEVDKKDFKIFYLIPVVL